MSSPNDSLGTNPTLLERIRHWSDQTSWQEFVDRYGRLIYSVAVKGGLSDAEAKDVAQETLLGLAKGIGNYRYDPERCSFKNWLLQLTRWRIINRYRKRTREQQIFDRSADDLKIPLEELPDPAGFELGKIWEQEWKASIYRAACEEVKRQVSAEQFQVFDLLVNEHWTVERLSRTLDLSRPRIYLAKHRVLRLVQKEVRRFE